jgi:hypothetical protein
MKQKQPTLFPWFLAAIMLLFCGILAFAWYESKLANPIMLDETGQVKGS